MWCRPTPFDSDPCDTRFAWGDDAYGSVDSDRYSDALGGCYNRSPFDVTGITVESHYSLGEYDIVNLSASRSEGLEAWLQQNGYRVPPGTRAALKPYIRQGMTFFVAKGTLWALAKTGFSKLRPLQFAYESDRFMLRLRLHLRYVAPQPFDGGVATCGAQMATLDCETKCSQKVDYLFMVNRPKDVTPAYRDKSAAMLRSDCMRACVSSQKTAVDAATRYYTRDLPPRLKPLKQTLARLSGWSRARIEAMASAHPVASPPITHRID